MATEKFDDTVNRSTSLAMRFGEGGLQLRNFEDALAFGKAMIQTGFAPKGFNQASQVVWAVQTGAEIGLGPAASLQAFYIAPSGKPSLYAKSALAVCVARGALETDYDIWTEGEGDKLVGFFKFRRRGWPEHKVKSFALAKARKAGLIKPDSNWDKWGERMVQARVVGFSLHDYFEDVLMGCAIEGDYESIEPTNGDTAKIVELSREPMAPVEPDPLIAQLRSQSEPPIAGEDCDHTWSQRGEGWLCVSCKKFTLSQPISSNADAPSSIGEFVESLDVPDDDLPITEEQRQVLLKTWKQIPDDVIKNKLRQFSDTYRSSKYIRRRHYDEIREWAENFGKEQGS